MPLNSVANPAQLAILSTALDGYCRANGSLTDRDREDAAYMIMQMFREGTDDPDLLAAELKKRLAARRTSAV
ncbi:MAG: hypothetical protein AB7I79_00160 [Rhizobiaceae bacterium]